MKTPAKKHRTHKFNIAFGIQNWLVKHGFACDKSKLDRKQYRSLIKEFCNQYPDYVKGKGEMVEIREAFISKNFAEFNLFCFNKFNAANHFKITLKQF